jgi:hypothetical protein
VFRREGVQQEVLVEMDFTWAGNQKFQLQVRVPLCSLPLTHPVKVLMLHMGCSSQTLACRRGNSSTGISIACTEAMLRALILTASLLGMQVSCLVMVQRANTLLV